MSEALFRMLRLVAAIGVLLVACTVKVTAADADTRRNTILVLDGSGSMWGQINGRHKILIARDVIGDVLQQLPDGAQPGLMAYGHNRKGDCDDIELIADVGASKATIRHAVDSITPLGKTPLSAAVQKAAEHLQHRDQPATVVLISDGEETCNLDPCAAGAALEASGVDFTAHVVGFGLANSDQRAQLMCLAQETGGRYFDAADADGLAEALQQTIAKPVETATPATTQPANEAVLYVRATDLADGPIVEDGLKWQIVNASDDTVVRYQSANPEGPVQLDAAPQGRYRVSVERAQDGARAAGEIFLPKGGHKTLTLALEITLTASVRTEPATRAPAGSMIDVYWEGPERPNDWVGIATPDAPAHDYLRYKYTKAGSPVRLKLPIDIGSYEVRYVVGHPARVLARTAISTTDISGSVSAATEAIAGSELAVSWTGPNYKNDWIALVKPGQPNNKRFSYAYTKAGSPLLVKTPIHPGEYEVRYVTGQGSETLATQAVQITEVSATLNAPATVAAGAQLPVQWTGPDYRGDWIGPALPGAPDKAHETYNYTRKGNPLQVAAPPKPGHYVLKYVSKRRVLATKPLEVTPVSAALTAPAKAQAGSTIDVTWTGPNYRSDHITIAVPAADAKKYVDFGYTNKGSPVQIELPTEPGTYELRYIMRPGRVVLARKSIDVY